MGDASYVQDSFLGGEISKSAQGQVTHRGYRTWMNVCRNGFPLEQGAWTRRPGTRFTGTTRRGFAGRVLPFQFKQALPYTMEFTDGFLRFRQGPRLVTTNDDVTISSISAANPAVVSVTPAPGWATGDQIILNMVGAEVLHARPMLVTMTGPQTFSLTDAISGANIDGGMLGSAFVSGTASRFLELPTPYTNQSWLTLRAVQSEIPTASTPASGSILLHKNFPPYVLQVLTQPDPTTFATFSLNPATFRDGPYLDPVKGGALLTPSGLSGVITATITFPPFDNTKAYQKADFVSVAGINYQSLADINLAHNPPASPTFWMPVSSGVAIGPNGFQGTDLGRLMRFYSEPPIWDATVNYPLGGHVSYPNGVNGAFVYWKAVAANINVQPGTDTTKWAVDPAGAIWTWGRISGLANLIDPVLAGSINIGSLTGGGGIGAAFDGISNKPAGTSALSDNGSVTSSQFIGKNYTTSPQKISSAVVFPPSDQAISIGQIFSLLSTAFQTVTPQLTINLRAKQTAPATTADGTLLGTSGLLVANSTAPVSISSSDTTTAWNFVWVEIVSVLGFFPPGTAIPEQNRIGVAQAQFFNPVAAGAGNAVTLQILGDKLLYTTPIRVWRMGLYSNSTGWPTCGTYHEGRLWLSGVYANRIDSSVGNDIFNFAPTNVDGSVGADRGISYVFNSPDANPIFWLEPDQLGIVCGTQAGEWLVQATSTNLPLTPTTIQAHRYTKYNCANILPARTNLTLAVVQTFRRSILEYFADVFSGRFSAHDLAVNAKHIAAKTFMQEITFQQEIIPMIWVRLLDGTLAGCVYERRTLNSSMEAEIFAWHAHALGSDHLVESLCLGANENGTLDALMMVTNDPTPGPGRAGVRHVELMTKVFIETDDPANAWFLDDAAMPTTMNDLPVSTALPLGGAQFNGLWHLNGDIVQVTVSGLDCGQFSDGTISDFLVSNGSITVPYGDGISGGPGGGLFTKALATAAMDAGQIVVGYTYTSDAQIVRPNSPAESGARNGPAFGKLRRNHQYALLTSQTAGVSIGTNFNALDPVLFGSNPDDPGGSPPLAINQVFNGVYRATLTDDNTFDGMLCWRIERPRPATVVSIGGFIHTQDI